MKIKELVEDNSANNIAALETVLVNLASSVANDLDSSDPEEPISYYGGEYTGEGASRGNREVPDTVTDFDKLFQPKSTTHLAVGAGHGEGEGGVALPDEGRFTVETDADGKVTAHFDDEPEKTYAGTRDALVAMLKKVNDKNVGTFEMYVPGERDSYDADLTLCFVEEF